MISMMGHNNIRKLNTINVFAIDQHFSSQKKMFCDNSLNSLYECDLYALSDRYMFVGRKILNFYFY